MAKLSLKGIVSLSHQIIKDGKTNTHNIELFQDDFEDCVMLTVEEAKGLLEISRDYRMYLFEHCRIPLSLSVNEAFTALRERIEQAEDKE